MRKKTFFFALQAFFVCGPPSPSPHAMQTDACKGTQTCLCSWPYPIFRNNGQKVFIMTADKHYRRHAKERLLNINKGMLIVLRKVKRALTLQLYGLGGGGCSSK